MAKTLILYFSVYNSTHKLAKKISPQTSSDFLEIARKFQKAISVSTVPPL